MSPSLTPQTVLELSPQQIATRLEHEVVILNTHTGRYYTLSGVGTKIWELLQTPSTPQKLQETILSQYNVSQDQCQADLSRILGELHDAGLLQLS
jgi:hypothetical protein